jgi:hypothetical protein
MLRHYLLVALAAVVLELRRPLDVGEEEGDRAVRQLAHATIVTDRQRPRAMIEVWRTRA